MANSKDKNAEIVKMRISMLESEAKFVREKVATELQSLSEYLGRRAASIRTGSIVNRLGEVQSMGDTPDRACADLASINDRISSLRSLLHDMGSDE